MHAGWRGVAAGILEEGMAAALRAGARLPSLAATIGPGSVLLSLEVGPEVAARFDPETIRPGRGARPHIDLPARGPLAALGRRPRTGGDPPGRALHPLPVRSLLLGPRRRADRPHGGFVARAAGEQPAIVGLCTARPRAPGRTLPMPARAARPTRARNAGSRASSTAIADMPATSPGSRRNPLTPSTITFGMPPIWVAITATPELIASRARPGRSSRGSRGKRKTSASGSKASDVLLLTEEGDPIGDLELPGELPAGRHVRPLAHHQQAGRHLGLGGVEHFHHAVGVLHRPEVRGMHEHELFGAA